MPKRTYIDDYTRVEAADDLEHLVKDKREAWRASKRNKHRRHRHYVKTMLRHLADNDDPHTTP